MNSILPFAVDPIIGIYSEEIFLSESFPDLAHRFAHLPGTTVLMSGGDLDCARYHILGIRPWLDFSGRRNQLTLRVSDKTFNMENDPFTVLDEILKAWRPDQTIFNSIPDKIPLACGLLGYLSYDLKDCLEVLPRTSVDRSGLPHIQLSAHSILVVQDKVKNSTRIFIPEFDKDDGSADANLNFFRSVAFSERKVSDWIPIRTGNPVSNFTRENYERNIRTIIDYIASGDVYQVNMSQKFEADFSGDAFTLFKNYFQANPAPFFAYVNAGDHQIISTSPERFLTRTGDKIEARPIKGTRPRGKTEDADLKLRQELADSKKDDAELSMIVDLMRNDIGKVCTGGSVYVAEHKRVEAYRNVFHLVSIVKGTLHPQKDTVDLLRATFPGGSITGCPKIRSMEIIDELEPDRRHIYTGSIGYISFHDTMDLSIAIRTATVHNGKLNFSVGGGIVFDSDPAEEYEETLHKSQTLMSAFTSSHKDRGGKQKEPTLWSNGILVPARTAAVPVKDPGFQYGFGFFETIRADSGKPRRLFSHIERFNRSWKELFTDDAPDLTWEIIIQRVLAANGLGNEPAAVKIIAAKGDRDIPPFTHSLFVTARPYTHRLEGKKDPGIHLAVYPHPRQSPLADHKTLNYLYYYLAGKWAAQQGKDEALILNPDTTVSETNTASLILVRGKTAVVPCSPHVLPGVMQKAILKLLESGGYEISEKAVRMEEISDCEDLLVTNALIGAVPVLSIDGRNLPSPSDLWKRINGIVIGNG